MERAIGRWTAILNYLYTECHKNLTNSLAAVTRSQTDEQTRRQTWCPHKALFITASWRISENQTSDKCIFLIKLFSIREWSRWCYELGSGLKSLSLGTQWNKSKLSALYLTTIHCVRWTVGYTSRSRMSSYYVYNGSATHTVHCVCVGGNFTSLVHAHQWVWVFGLHGCEWNFYATVMEDHIESGRSLSCMSVHMYIGMHVCMYVRGLLEKYPTVFFYANTWWIII